MKKLLTLTVVLWSIGWALPGFAQGAGEIDYQQKLQALQETIKDLEKELESVKGNRSELQMQLESSESKISELLEKIEEIKSELKTGENALRDLQSERKLLVSEQLSQKKHVAQQVRAAYRLGGQSNLKLLLNQDNPQHVSRMLRYYDYMLHARTDKLTSYISTIDELNRVEPQIVGKTASLKQNQQNLQSRRQQLVDAQAQRKQTLARLDATIKNKDEELKKLASDRESVERVLKQITEVVISSDSPRPFSESSKAFTSLRGKLPWPTKGAIAHKFGSDRVAGKMKWEGVVINAQEGTPVRAIHHGRVVFADYLRGQGLLVILDHGDGYMSLYGHNQTLNKNVGSWVESGEIIAKVGASGGQTQAGLYFEIRQNGKPTNPNRWCG